MQNNNALLHVRMNKDLKEQKDALTKQLVAELQWGEESLKKGWSFTLEESKKRILG